MNLVEELESIVRVFTERGIDYAFCGAVALAVHGVPRATQDIDVLAQPEDLPRIREAVRSLGFVFETQPMTFSSSGITVVRFTKLIEKQPFMLDILFADGPLANVWSDRITVPWQGGDVKVVSRAGLVTLKLAAGRPQDVADIARLEELDRG